MITADHGDLLAEYHAGGIFNGALVGPRRATAGGVLEVGSQIGCGIDMSTSNGVTLTGSRRYDAVAWVFERGRHGSPLPDRR